MKSTRLCLVVAFASCTVFAGCKSSGSSARRTGDRRQQQQREPERKPVYTASHNPTTLAGRGMPSLDDQFRPAAWILVDGLEGNYIDVEGHPHLEWVIDRPVSSKPTFRVEVFSPLLGEPEGFKAVLQSIHTQDGSQLVYGIAADMQGSKSSFEPGKTYDLLNPGPNFVIRNLMTGDVVQQIGELPPGKYAFAGGIRNIKTGAETPAVTFFTVGQ